MYFDFDKTFGRANNVMEEASSVIREVMQIEIRHKDPAALAG